MKIKCLNPKHKDDTPSMEVYPDWLHCFSCGYRVRSDGVISEEEIENLKKKQKEPENIEDRIRFIHSLPRQAVRGLSLPIDTSGYYIVWPTGTYYKYRITTGGQNRYIGPRGHKAPLFELDIKSKETLVVIEGEINALSLSESLQDHQLRTIGICSPGSATELTRHLNIYLTYPRIIVIVDKDIPGVKNGLKLKELLIKKGKRVQLLACENDINEILQEKGKGGVQDWWRQAVEV